MYLANPSSDLVRKIQKFITSLPPLSKKNLKLSDSPGLHPPGLQKVGMKRSRARVTIGGQCVLIQNSLKIKIYVFLKPKLPYESHLSRYTSETLKKIVNILETRFQSSKFMLKTKVHWCSAFNSFFVFHPEAKQRKYIKKILGQNCFENGVSDFENNLNFPLNFQSIGPLGQCFL